MWSTMRSTVTGAGRNRGSSSSKRLLLLLLVPLVACLSLTQVVVVMVNAFSTTTPSTSFSRRQQQQHVLSFSSSSRLLQLERRQQETNKNVRNSRFALRHRFPSIPSSSSSNTGNSLLALSASSSSSSTALEDESSSSEKSDERSRKKETTTTAKKADVPYYIRKKRIKSRLNPSWRKILEVPIDVDTQSDFDGIPFLKRMAIVSRVSVLHLTLLSCGGPFVLRGATLAAASSTATTAATATSTATALTPLLALLFTIDGLSWHAVHNLLNDWQDLDDDDSVEDSFRLSYGCHALKQGFLSKPQFLRIMAATALPGLLLTILVFRNTVLAPAALYGILALFFYTILFKPLALGEIVIYMVWGPLMAGFGQLAAGAPWTAKHPLALFTDPTVALFGLAGLAVIMGKHTDKIRTSRKRTLPKLLGFPASLWACGFTIVAPHVVLAATFFRERLLHKFVVSTSSTAAAAAPAPSIPIGAALAFLALFREVPAALTTLSKGPPTDQQTANGKRPPLWARGKVLKGTLVDANINTAWPLWFVAFCGWHALTFTYLMVIGSGAEWAVRVAASRFGLFGL